MAMRGSRLSQGKKHSVVNHDTKFSILEDKIRSWHLDRGRGEDGKHSRGAACILFSQRG